GDPRLAGAADAVADLRPHPVAADQRAPPDALARVQDQGDGVVILLVTLDAALRLEADEIVALAGFQKCRMDVGTVGDRVGMFETAEEARVIERDSRNQL